MRVILAIFVTFLSLIGIGASISYFFREGHNPGFGQFPIIMGTHVVLGAIYLSIAPLQFVDSIRRRAIQYHRGAGRLLAVVGTGLGVTALFIGLVIPYSGLAEQAIIGGFALFYLFALGKAVYHIRARRVALHREWMIRAFAIGLAIATMRVIFVPALVIVGDQQAKVLSIASFTVAFVLHSIIAEIWIYRTRDGT